MPFNEMLEKLRKERGLTQEDLAKLTGLKRSAIGMYENGKREPSIEVLEIFANFFNVSMDVLLDRAIYQPKDAPVKERNFIEYLASNLTPKGKELLEKHLIILATDPDNLDPNQFIKDTMIENLTPEALEKRKALVAELRIQRKWAKAVEREAKKKQLNPPKNPS